MIEGPGTRAQRDRVPGSTPSTQKTDPGKRQCLLVLGMHRSGTSALTRVLSIAGAALPRNLMGPGEGNASGHWESETLVALHDGLLLDLNSAWHDWRPLDVGTLQGKRRQTMKADIRAVVAAEYANAPLVVIKDPRICRFVPLFVEALDEAHYDVCSVLIVRNPLEVIESLIQRKGRWPRHLTAADGGLLWLRHLLDSESATRSGRRIVISHEGFMRDWAAVLQRISTELSVSFPFAAREIRDHVDSFLDPGQRHHSRTTEELRLKGRLGDWLIEAYSACLVLSQCPDTEAAFVTLDRIRSELDAATPALNSLSEERRERSSTELERATAALDDAAAKITHLASQLADHEKVAHEQMARASELELQLNREQAVRSESERHSGDLERALTVTRQERQSLFASHARAEHKITELVAEIAKLQFEADNRRLIERSALLDNINSHLSAKESELKELASNRDELLVSVETWRSKALAIEPQLIHAQQLIEAFNNSTSWRLTAPIRLASTFYQDTVLPGMNVKALVRKAFYSLPLSTKRRQAWLDKYHYVHRLRAKWSAGRQPTMTSPQSLANLVESEASTLEIPNDGRWQREVFVGTQLLLRKVSAALVRPDDEGGISETDLFVPPAHTGPLITLVVRTYRGRWPLAATALASIASQTYRPIEVIVVENGSAAYAKCVCDLNRNDGITFRHVALDKLGRSAAANAGLAAATGELVGFLDDDDYLLPQHCSLLAGHLLAQPSASAAYAACLEIEATIDPVEMRVVRSSRENVYFRLFGSSGELINSNPFPIQCILFRNRIRSGADQFDRNLDYLEDWLFWLRLLVGHFIVPVPEITSAFHVPANIAAQRTRLAAHRAAEEYFNTQRSAFFESRRLSDLREVNDNSRARMARALSRATLPVQHTVRSTAPGIVKVATPLRRVLETDCSPLLAPKFKQVAFTSINLRYLPKALVWAQSVKKHNPDWETHILLNDAVPSTANNWPNVDRVQPIRELPIPHFDRWAFCHTVVELCTATKAFYSRTLLAAGYDHVFYFDPDTHVYSDLSFLVDEMTCNDILLTPHCCQDSSTEAEIHYNEMSSLAHGLFNLGFIGLKQGDIARALVDFWCRRMERHCVDDHARGLFTDQKWFNFVPLFFDRVKILKHKGCNTASWNIAYQPIGRSGSAWLAGDDPLVFFHFSGYDKNVPRRMFDIFGRFNDDLGDLITEYDDVNNSFASRYTDWKKEWALARYDNGQPIINEHRELYRNRFGLQIAFPQPFYTRSDLSFANYLKRLAPAEIAAQTSNGTHLRRHF